MFTIDENKTHTVVFKNYCSLCGVVFDNFFILDGAFVFMLEQVTAQ